MSNRNRKMNAYMRAIKRKLNMPGTVKQRVMSDFASSVEARREDGYTDEQIFTEFGSPKKAAAELNEQMKEFTYRKSPWRWICFILILLCSIGIVLQCCGLIAAGISFPAHSVGIIGGADGPTSIFIATPPDYFRNQLILLGIALTGSILGFWMLSHQKRK